MKMLITLLLSACSFMVHAQTTTRQSLHQGIDDDGKTLTIDISGTSGGKAVSYYRQFNVTGMSKSFKEAMIKRITDSLGVNTAAHLPVPPLPAARFHVQSSGTNSVHSSIKEHGDTLMVMITGTKNDLPLNYKRTFKVKGLSQQAKDAIVRHVTDSLGISGSVR